MDLRTLGVEEEFLLVDSDGFARPAGEEVVPAEHPDGEDSERLEHELTQQQAEIGSKPRVSLTELRADLVDRRQALAAAAARHDVRIAALATCPTAVEPTTTNDPRYLAMMDEYALTAREQLTCGCHVHVAINSRAEGVAVVNAIQPWLSTILALSANSPFWQGQDTGYVSYRRMVWDRWPGAGPTTQFADEHDYDGTVEALLRSQILMDDAMVYFDARLSAKYPTVEVRVADVCTQVDDAVLVGALCRSLVDAAAQSWQDGAPWPAARIELLRGAAWRAARSGLDGDLVDPLTGTAEPAEARLQKLVDRVRPSLVRYGDLELVESSFQRLLDTGNGAAQQRKDFAGRGSLRDVTLEAARRTQA